MKYEIGNFCEQLKTINFSKISDQTVSFLLFVCLYNSTPNKYALPTEPV